ncbi:MAG: transcription elongation factor subunit Spt4 [Candidatus Geothermarchaeales archaeon]
MKRLRHMKACKTCKYLIPKGNVCPVCGSTSLSSSWYGYVYVIDVNSQIAKIIGAKTEGGYAVVVR